MKKNIFVAFAFLLMSVSAYSQLSGPIANDNRKLLTDQGFVVKGHLNGKISFAIAVNAEGEISSADVIDSETTIKSTPAKIKAFQYVKTFRFEPGTWFPKFHQGKIVLTMEKEGEGK